MIYVYGYFVSEVYARCMDENIYCTQKIGDIRTFHSVARTHLKPTVLIRQIYLYSYNILIGLLAVWNFEIKLSYLIVSYE